MTAPILHFSRREYDRRIARTRAAMAQSGVDVLVVTDPSNINWLTGYDGWSFYVHQAVVLESAGEPLWFGREQDAAGAFRTCFMHPDRIVGYPDSFVQAADRHPMTRLAEVLKQNGARKAAIGVEMDNYFYTAAADRALRRGLPDAAFQDAAGLVNWRRAIKSEAELDCMRKAGAIVGRMHRRIAEIARPGMRKCDLAAEIYAAGLRYDEAAGYGGDYPAIAPLLPSGADAAAPHLTWDDRPLRAGEGVFFEIAGVVHRYHCPLARTVFFGKPPPAMRGAEQAVLEGLNQGLEKARAGNRCEDIAAAFFAVLKRHGIEKNNRAGYAVGLSYPPDWGERTMSIRAGDAAELRPGMTFHFMPGLWMETWGLEITETIAITDGAPECLAAAPREMLVKD